MHREIDGDVFADLLSAQKHLRLVFLNACEGAAVSSARPLVGLAPELLYRGVPAVIGLQFRIFDDVAIAFSRAFYEALFRGPTRGLVDVAITKARRFLGAEFGDDDAAVRAFGEPVLFLRGVDGTLFYTRNRSLASAFSPSEVSLGRHAQQVATTESTDIQIDPDSRREIRKHVLRREWFRRIVLVAATCILTGIVSALGACGGLKGAGIDQAWQAFIISRAAPATRQSDIVLITPDDPRQWGLTWRERHAKLIQKLIESRPKLIVFDVEFRGDSAADAQLASAMQAARAQNIPIVTIADELATEGAPARNGEYLDDRLPQIPSALRGCLSGTGVSLVPVGPDKAISNPPQAALWFFDASTPTHKVGGVPGLAFAAYCVLLGVDLSDAADTRKSIDRPRFTAKTITVLDRAIPFIFLDHWKSERRDARIRAGDQIVKSIYQICEHDRVSYETAVDASPTELIALREKLHDKVVFIGNDHDPNDQYTTPDGGRRAGVQIQADIFASLQVGSFGRMYTGVEFGLLLVMGILAALLAGAVRWSLRRRIIIFGALLLGYAMLAMFIMLDMRLLFDPSYPMLAAVLTFSAHLWIEQRWYRHSES